MSHVSEERLPTAKQYEDLPKQHAGGFSTGLKQVLIAGTGFLADAYDLFAIDLVLAILTTHHTPGRDVAWLQSLAVSSALIGCVVGQVLFGLLGDYFGRRRCFLATCFLILFGNFGAALLVPGLDGGPSSGKQTFLSLAVFRFVLGLGVGGEYPLVAAIAVENSGGRPVTQQIAAVFSMQGWGVLLACLTSYGFLAWTNFSLDAVWRLTVAFGAIPTLLVIKYRAAMLETEEFRRVVGAERGGGDSPRGVVEVASSRGRASGWEGGGSSSDQQKTDKISAVPLAVQATKMRGLWLPLFGTSLAWLLQGVTFYGTGCFKTSVVGAAFGGAESSVFLYSSTVASGFVDGENRLEGQEFLAEPEASWTTSPRSGGAVGAAEHEDQQHPQRSSTTTQQQTSMGWDSSWRYRTEQHAPVQRSSPPGPATASVLSSPHPKSSFLEISEQLSENHRELGELRQDRLRTALATSLKDQALAALIIGLVALPGYLTAVALITSLGAKPLQLGGFLAMAGCFGAAGFAARRRASAGGEDARTSTSTPILALFALTFFFSNFGPNTTTYVIPAVAFPTGIRTTCHGISAAFGKVGAAVGTSLFAPVLESQGLAAVLWGCCCVSLAGGFVTWACVPGRGEGDAAAVGEDDAGENEKGK